MDTVNWYELHVTEDELRVIRDALQFHSGKKLDHGRPHDQETARDLDFRFMAAKRVIGVTL